MEATLIESQFVLVSDIVHNHVPLLLLPAAIACVQLANPTNGLVSQPKPTLVGSEAVYTCNFGFRLSGSSKLVCRSNGRYSDAPPTCIRKCWRDHYTIIHCSNTVAIVCGKLSNPINGAVTQENPPLVGTKAIYTCRKGFVLVGSSRRICQNNGRYSGSAPNCDGECLLYNNGTLMHCTLWLQLLCVISSVIPRMVKYLNQTQL